MFCHLFLVMAVYAVEFCWGDPNSTDLRANATSKMDENVTSLNQLFMVFRHGAKVPSTQFLQGEDKNVFKDYVGQLTNEGKSSIFRLGKAVRQRYGNFIGHSYDSQRFFLGSTDVERTLMSAQTFSLGLFPPEGSHVWNPDVMWQPIPVFPLQFSLDGSIESLMGCIAGSLSAVCEHQDEMFTKQNKKILTIMSNLVYGSSNSNNTNGTVACDFTSFLGLDDLSTMIWYNLTLPEELRGMENEIDILKTVIIKAMSSPNSTCGKSVAGALFKSFLQRITDLESGRTRYDTAIYSEHDISVFSAVMALSDVDIRSPSFGANIILEVHNPPPNSTHRKEVHMWYAPSAEEPCHRIPFKANNNDTISLDDFKIALQKFMETTKN